MAKGRRRSALIAPGSALRPSPTFRAKPPPPETRAFNPKERCHLRLTRAVFPQFAGKTMPTFGKSGHLLPQGIRHCACLSAAVGSSKGGGLLSSMRAEEPRITAWT